VLGFEERDLIVGRKLEADEYIHPGSQAVTNDFVCERPRQDGRPCQGRTNR
jgi:hypothetical protein